MTLLGSNRTTVESKRSELGAGGAPGADARHLNAAAWQEHRQRRRSMGWHHQPRLSQGAVLFTGTMDGSSQPAAAEQAVGPPVKRCRVEPEPSLIDLTGSGSSQEEAQAVGRPSGPAPQPGQLLESQRLLSKAAELRKQAAEGQAAREAAAAAAEARRQAAAELVLRAVPQVAAAEQRACEDAQTARESARSSIEAAAAAITASAEQQAVLSRALGQDGGAVQRQLDRARAAAAAAATASKERLEGEAQEAVKPAWAQAEVA